MDDKPLSPGQRLNARIRKWAESSGVPLRTILVTLGLIVVLYLGAELLFRLRILVLLFAVAGFLALMLNPAVIALQRRRRFHARGLAVAVVTAWLLVAFIGLAVAFGYPLLHGLTHLAANLPGYVQHAEHGRGWIGSVIRRYHLLSWVQRNAPKLDTLAQRLARPAISLGKGVVSVLAELVTIFALLVLLLLEAPKMRRFLLGLLSPEHADRYTHMGGDINKAISGYVLGDVITSIVAGGVILITLLTLGVPYALLFALWVALVDFLPVIGGALAGIPTVLFALVHSLSAGIVVAIVFIVYTQVENHVLNPVVMRRTVKANPLLISTFILVGAILGSYIGGAFGAFVAALLAIPLAGIAQVVAREVWRDLTNFPDDREATTPAESSPPPDP